MRKAWKHRNTVVGDAGSEDPVGDGDGSGGGPTTKNADDFIKIALLWFLLDEFDII